jgi:DNA-binding winged helix-turn-helix (wHTH) protein
MKEKVMTVPQPLGIHATRYQDTHLTVEFEREVAYLDGTPLKLTYKAYSLLAFLVRHPGELVPRETLLASVWGYTPEIRTRTLDVHIRRLRKSLAHYGTTYIETIFGIGYRFQPSHTASRPNNAASSALAQCVVVEEKRQWKMAGTTAY